MMEPIISNKTVSQPVLWDIMEAQLETIVPSVKMVVQFVPIQEIHVAVVSMFLSALLMECAMTALFFLPISLMSIAEFVNNVILMAAQLAHQLNSVLLA